MRIAVIDHIGNYGGGSRVVRALLPAIRKVRPETEISYFGNPVSMQRENIQKEFHQVSISVTPLNSVRLPSKGLFNLEISAKVIRYFQMCFWKHLRNLPYVLSGEVHREVEKKVKGYDLAFFPWPFLISVPNLKCPLVGIFHDFNFRYYFTGRCTYTKQQEDRLRKEIPEWLQKATPVVSTHFMASELAKFYPEFSQKTRVVHLASMSTMSAIGEQEAKEVVRSLGVISPYILYPTNMHSHKNVGQIVLALRVLRKQGYNLRLILTGPGTERIRGRACDIGVELGHVAQDVLGLGYVSNLQMDSLVQYAAVVVSSSLYEAGNGPGLDAWRRGVPVAMSNIPAFVEHLDVQGVKAEVFDPHNPMDIALKISAILSNPERAAIEAAFSREALKEVTWEQTAEKYFEIFEESLNN